MFHDCTQSGRQCTSPADTTSSNKCAISLFTLQTDFISLVYDNPLRGNKSQHPLCRQYISFGVKPRKIWQRKTRETCESISNGLCMQGSMCLSQRGVGSDVGMYTLMEPTTRGTNIWSPPRGLLFLQHHPQDVRP